MNNREMWGVVVLVIVLLFIGLFFNMNRPYFGMMGGYYMHDDDDVRDFEIYPRNVAEMMNAGKNITLLDVRNPEEFEEMHLKGALLLPVQDISAKSLSDIGLGEDAKDKEIYIYCHSGSRSKIAYDLMHSLGYTNIKSIAGGMVHWQEDKYPFTETGAYMGMGYGMMGGFSNQDSQEDSAKVEISPSSYNFGEIPKSGGSVSTTFQIKNTGSKTLKIGELSTSCGCTTAEISESNIEPNNTATLTVVFDPNFHTEPLGQITRTVFIPTNDPKRPELEAKIIVDILEDK